MVQIREHNKKDSKNNTLKFDTYYTPICDWPEDCTVQWGGIGGPSFGKPPYTETFFEAFPKDGGYLRGEGKTFDQAEKACFLKWQKMSQCNHLWARHGNHGYAKCRNCGEGKSFFNPIVELGAWKKPINGHQISAIAEGCIQDVAWSKELQKPRQRKWRRHLYLKAKQAKLKLPPTPGPSMDPEDEETRKYTNECAEVCFQYYKEIYEKIDPDNEQQIQEFRNQFLNDGGLAYTCFHSQAIRKGYIVETFPLVEKRI